MKKIRFLIISLLLCIMIPSMALAQDGASLSCAAKGLDPDQFSRYSAYSMDEKTGLWRVHAYPADALLDQLWEYGSVNSTALAAFHLELEGNANTGVLTPIFRFYYVDGKKPINATAVSFLIDGVRYDLAAASTGKMPYGRESAEVISAPLTKEALVILPALAEGQSVSVRILGDQIYTLELDDATSGRKGIQNYSLSTIPSDYALLQEAGINDYALWDLSYFSWESTYGFVPAFASYTAEYALCGETVSDAFGMLLPSSEGKAARAAQEMLIEHGFLAGSAGSIFNDQAVAAVRRAQKYYGLIVTGCMDSQLENTFASQIEVSSDQETAYLSLGDSANIALDRYWFASGVSAANGADLRAVANKNHALLIADGMIQNISPNTMHLFMQLEARVVYSDGYAYEATVLCEQNDGSKLDTMLLPMDQARLILFAEIPGDLTNAPADQWCIELSIDGDTLKFPLK